MATHRMLDIPGICDSGRGAFREAVPEQVFEVRNAAERHIRRRAQDTRSLKYAQFDVIRAWLAVAHQQRETVNVAAIVTPRLLQLFAETAERNKIVIDVPSSLGYAPYVLRNDEQEYFEEIQGNIRALDDDLDDWGFVGAQVSILWVTAILIETVTWRDFNLFMSYKAEQAFVTSLLTTALNALEGYDEEGA
jgi:hypothetical protein